MTDSVLKKFASFLLVMYCSVLGAKGINLSDSLHKIKFIGELRAFIRNDLRLKVNENFYMEYLPGPNMLTYLYVSSPDSISTALQKPFMFFGTNEQNALKKKSHYDSLGMHTLIYHSAGNSDAQINRRLLEYDNASIAFILLHEAVHQHLKNLGIKIPYEIEEALCDINGNYAALLFSKKHHHLRKSKARTQIKLDEDIYRSINFWSEHIRDKNQGDKKKLFRQCDSSLVRILKHAPLFQHDRYGYTINNAFFLRNSFYGENYFLLKDVLAKYEENDLRKFLELMFTLPSEKKELLEILRKKSMLN